MAKTMKAARYVAGEHKLELAEVPVPQPGPLEVLVEVEACGICLSDVHLVDGTIPPLIPVVIPGHESCGVIAATGDAVAGWKEGERVVLTAGRGCAVCDRCRSGGFDRCEAFELLGFHYDGAWAEYVAVPHYTLAAVPDGVPPEQAAILADAVATPYAALIDRATLRPSESVGLWGIGGLGTHAVQLARLAGAALVVAVDPLASARERALKVGADLAIDPTTSDTKTEVMRATGGSGLDVAVDLVGANPVLKEAVSCLARGGRAVMVGLSMDPIELGPSLLFGTRRTAVLGHLGYQKHHLDDLVRLLAAGRLDLSASISDVISLEDVADGVRRLATKEGDPVRIIVKP
jgi:2-desacetyl-2-hydroxyethyl bacteriochlorophyllide A dehydrogenase